MRLKVFWPWKTKQSTRPTSVFYIEIYEDGDHRPARDHEIQYLRELLPRIKSLGKKLLQTEFNTVVLNESAGRLELDLKKGIVSRGNKKAFDSFRGWIEVCMME